MLAVNVGRVHSVCFTEYYCFGFYDLSFFFCILKEIVLLFDYIKIKKQLLMKNNFDLLHQLDCRPFLLSLFLFSFSCLNIVCPGEQREKGEDNNTSKELGVSGAGLVYLILRESWGYICYGHIFVNTECQPR